MNESQQQILTANELAGLIQPVPKVGGNRPSEVSYEPAPRQIIEQQKTAEYDNDDDDLEIKNHFRTWQPESAPRSPDRQPLQHDNAQITQVDVPRTTTNVRRQQHQDNARSKNQRTKNSGEPAAIASNSDYAAEEIAVERKHIHIGIPRWLPSFSFDDFSWLGDLVSKPFSFINPKTANNVNHAKLHKPAGLFGFTVGSIMVAVGFKMTYDGLGIFVQDENIAFTTPQLWVIPSIDFSVSLQLLFATAITLCVIVCMLGDRHNKTLLSFAYFCFGADIVTNFLGLLHLDKLSWSWNFIGTDHITKAGVHYTTGGFFPTLGQDFLFLGSLVFFAVLSYNLTRGGFEFISFALHRKLGAAFEYTSNNQHQVSRRGR